MAGSHSHSTTPSSNLEPIVVDGRSFALNGRRVSYRFHVDEATGDLISDHFGGLVTEDPVVPEDSGSKGGWATDGYLRREFPDQGRGDFRIPAVVIEHERGFTVSHFKYRSHTVLNGKSGSPNFPSTFGEDDQVATLTVHMYDSHSFVAADLAYSIFPEHDAIARSVRITNQGKAKTTIRKLASLSVDLPHREYDMVGLRGEWTRECSKLRRRIEYGMQGFGSATGYSSHFHNPFLSIVTPATTETQGEAWGFSLIYSGSFTSEVEKSPRGLVRATMGMNTHQLSWSLEAGETLASPECVAVFSDAGIGGMSRRFHRLYRQNLIRSKFVDKPRPALLNSWESVYFNFDEDTIEKLARASESLGVKLFVLDDGWFGVKYPRINDAAGLGDWKANPARFPHGLKSIAEKVSKMQAEGSQVNLKFGLWIEPEMVNPKSELYESRPNWALSAGDHIRTEARSQLILNLALPEVQDYIIGSIAALLRDAPISYIKWDHNRGTHESPTPQNYHGYVLGMYRVFEELTGRFPDVLWEGCASGGGRFDPGVLHYFPQIWASDNMDGLDRIHIQFGTSVVYPPSTMGAHIGAVPSHVTGRTQSLEFRAHVAMMGGSFGLELDPDRLLEEERGKIPHLITLAERINPVVINGDLWRLKLPEESNHPAALFVSEDGSQAVLFAFQLLSRRVHENPILQLQGLELTAKYRLDGMKVVSGATLMNGGIQFVFESDYDSKVMLLERV